MARTSGWPRNRTITWLLPVNCCARARSTASSFATGASARVSAAAGTTHVTTVASATSDERSTRHVVPKLGMVRRRRVRKIAAERKRSRMAFSEPPRFKRVISTQRASASPVDSNVADAKCSETAHGIAGAISKSSGNSRFRSPPTGVPLRNTTTFALQPTEP